VYSTHQVTLSFNLPEGENHPLLFEHLLTMETHRGLFLDYGRGERGFRPAGGREITSSLEVDTGLRVSHLSLSADPVLRVLPTWGCLRLFSVFRFRYLNENFPVKCFQSDQHLDKGWKGDSTWCFWGGKSQSLERGSPCLKAKKNAS